MNATPAAERVARRTELLEAVHDAAGYVIEAMRVAEADPAPDLFNVALELECLDSALIDLKNEWDWESDREWQGAA